jgi:hypothetical protein
VYSYVICYLQDKSVHKVDKVDKEENKGNKVTFNYEGLRTFIKVGVTFLAKKDDVLNLASTRKELFHLLVPVVATTFYFKYSLTTTLSKHILFIYSFILCF